MEPWRHRRILLAAGVGLVPLMIFIAAALHGEADTRKPLIAVGLVLGLVLFGVIAATKPAKHDD